MGMILFLEKGRDGQTFSKKNAFLLVGHALFIAAIYRLFYYDTITILHLYYNYTGNACQGSW